MTAFDVTLADIEAARDRIAGPRQAHAGLRERGRVGAARPAHGPEDGGAAARRLLQGARRVQQGADLSDEERGAASSPSRAATTPSRSRGGGNSRPRRARADAEGDAALQHRPDHEIRRPGRALRRCRGSLREGGGLPGQGRLFVHPYDDPAIIAGHGTLGLEFLETAGPHPRLRLDRRRRLHGRRRRGPEGEAARH